MVLAPSPTPSLYPPKCSNNHLALEPHIWRLHKSYRCSECWGPQSLLSKRINLMTACPHRNCKPKSLLMAFSFISCMIQGTENSEELSSKLQIPSRVIKIHVPGFGDSSSLITLVPLSPPPPLDFFLLPSALACKPCCFNFFPVLPVLLEHFIFNSQLIWRSATLRFNCLQR